MQYGTSRIAFVFTIKGKIMVHQYQMLDQNIVLDTCSGGVYSVDKMAYDIISMFEKNTKAEIIEKLSQ